MGGVGGVASLACESCQEPSSLAKCRSPCGDARSRVRDHVRPVPQDVISLLKKRLQQDKPQKQFLAVVLVDRVLAECHDVIGMQQEELLQEVARVMAKPARGDEVAVHRAKTAARELLRRFGRAGQDAFRAAARSAYARPPPPGGLPPGSALYAVEGMTGDGEQRASCLLPCGVLVHLPSPAPQSQDLPACVGSISPSQSPFPDSYPSHLPFHPSFCPQCTAAPAPRRRLSWTRWSA